MEAPNGFLFDPGSGLYYSEKRSKDAVTGETVRLVTWFDPNTGVSKQVSYPLEEEPAMATHLQIEEKQLVQPSEMSSPKPAAPEGFTLDEKSRLYYRMEKGRHPITGALIQRITYYDPEKKSYHSVDTPIEPAQAKETASTLQQEEYKPKRKKKGILFAVSILLVVAILGVLGFCAWKYNWFGKDKLISGNVQSRQTDMISPSVVENEDSQASLKNTEDGSSEEAGSSLAPVYEYTHKASGRAIILSFIDEQGFLLLYDDQDGTNKTVIGTYSLSENKITLHSELALDGWEEDYTFLILNSGSLQIKEPGDIGPFAVGTKLKPQEN